MGVAERRAREREALRTKILDAAGELFVEEGVTNVSIRKIADRIEYSPATIYLYFKDKGELLNNLCQETFSHLKSLLEEIEELVQLDPLQRLRLGLRAYIQFGVEHPNHYVLTFCTPCDQIDLPPDSEELRQTNQIGLETFDRLRQALQRCKDAGLVHFDDLESTSQAVWTHIHGTTSLIVTSHNDPCFPWVDKEALIERSLDLIIAGLKGCPGSN